MITLMLTACLIRPINPAMIYQQTLIKPVKVEVQTEAVEEVAEENLQEYVEVVEEPVPEDSCFDGPIEYGTYYDDWPGEDSLAWQMDVEVME